MDNKDFAIASNKVFYYLFNFNCEAISYPTIYGEEVIEVMPEFFKAFEPHLLEHLITKWKSGGHNTPEGAILRFYMELDGENRYRLLKWINENYIQRDTFGLTIPLEDDVRAQIDISSKLLNELRCCYCLTSEEKEDNEEPRTLTIGDYELYYDEGNEESKVINSKGEEFFWTELDKPTKMALLSAFDKMYR